MSQLLVRRLGSVNPNGKSTSAQFFSDIWLPGVGMSPPESIGSGVVALLVSYTATGLTPSPNNYYWVGAGNSDGSSRGVTVHFTTLPAVSKKAIQIELFGLS